MSKIKMNMYIDRDKNGKFSIMEMTREDISDLGAMLWEFEYLIQQGMNSKGACPLVREKARMVMSSAMLRFKISDALKPGDSSPGLVKKNSKG